MSGATLSGVLFIEHSALASHDTESFLVQCVCWGEGVGLREVRLHALHAALVTCFTCNITLLLQCQGGNCVPSKHSFSHIVHCVCLLVMRRRKPQIGAAAQPLTQSVSATFSLPIPLPLHPPGLMYHLHTHPSVHPPTYLYLPTAPCSTLPIHCLTNSPNHPPTQPLFTTLPRKEHGQLAASVLLISNFTLLSPLYCELKNNEQFFYTVLLLLRLGCHLSCWPNYRHQYERVRGMDAPAPLLEEIILPRIHTY